MAAFPPRYQQLAPAFYASRPDHATCRAGWGLMRALAWGMGVGRIEVPSADAVRLRAATTGTATILCGNHAAVGDGALWYLAVSQLGLRFHYGMAWESFGKLGLIGTKLLPRLGFFSVRRRVADQHAASHVRALLAARQTVAVCPEGEFSGMTDRVLPLEKGATRWAFWGLESLRRRSAADTPLFLLPGAAKHREPDTAASVRTIYTSLLRLEKAFALPAARAKCGALERLERVTDAFVAAREAELGLTPLPPATSLDVRWARVQRALETRLWSDLDREPPHSAADNDENERTPGQRVRDAFNAVEDEAARIGRGARCGKDARVDAAWRDAVRLHRFLGFKAGYVAAYPSVERFLDVLRPLEADVFGHAAFSPARRTVRLRIGEPINLAPLHAAYRADRKGTIADVTRELRARLQNVLREVSEETTRPWPGAFGAAAAPLASAFLEEAARP